MKRFAHISDLHFGAADPKIVAALAEDIRVGGTDVAVVTGDLTMRARAWQFEEATAFLSALERPVLVVPGNHDLAPIFEPFNRLFAPLRHWHTHMGGHAGHHEDEFCVLVGLDTARPLRHKEGRLIADEAKRARILMTAHRADDRVRVAFMHHPGAAVRAASTLAGIGVDLVLAGHVHVAGVRGIEVGGRTLVVSQVGTSCSTRLRGSANSYGVVTLTKAAIHIEHRFWSGECFEPGRRHVFRRGREGHWHAEGEGRV